MNIKAKCIKDLKADGITICKKGEVVSVDSEMGVYTKPLYDPICPYLDDERDPFFCSTRIKEIDCQVYRFRKDWLCVTFCDTEEAASRFFNKDGQKILVFGEYFEGISDMALTAENVENLHKACLTTKDTNFIVSFGIRHDAKYSRSAIEAHKAEIRSMFNQLPENFKKSKGGGWSFLNMCMTKDDVQWTGLHSTMEKLVTLGIAAQLCDYLLPKDMWDILPGGMPYIVFKD